MTNMVITISREYGSGGRQIGEQLAKELGFAFYDKDLLTIVAEKSGINEEVLEVLSNAPKPYEVEVIDLKITAEESLKRNRHAVRPEDIERMANSWEDWQGAPKH